MMVYGQPGYSLLCCKEKPKEPFVFTSVDTLVESDFDFMSIDENWLGVSSVDVNESINYCLVEGSKYLDKLYYGSGDELPISVWLEFMTMKIFGIHWRDIK